jgi:AcrR family transcriptional regulator
LRDTDLPAAPHKHLSYEDRILLAFQECVVENGLAKTGLNVVAQRAGVGRQTIYRKFENRKNLVQRAMIHRFRAFGDQAAQSIAKAATIEDAIVWGSVTTIKAIGRDRFYRAIGGWTAVSQTNMLSLRSNRGSSELILSVWGPLLAKAAAQGRLHSYLTIEEAAEYIGGMHWLLTWRPD